MKVWIDLANSPHVLFFEPVARRLSELGHELTFTVRDHAQTLELARERFPGVELIGGASPGTQGAKGTTMGRRAAALVRWARRERPDLALSHQSYGQLIAARALRIRSVTAMDFEHQPLNHLAFRLAGRVVLPRALEGSRTARQGAVVRKTAYYEGLKEELYLGDFEPDTDVLSAAGIDRRSDTVLVVARTPPSGATYHRFGNPLFLDALRAVADRPEATCVVLARHPEQREAITELGLAGVVVPQRALDSRSLMYAADLVLGAGGTMTREAALLGVPTFSLFGGERPAVDRWLEERGLLRTLRDASELAPLRRRESEPTDLDQLRQRGDALVGAFVDAALQRTPDVVRAPVAAGA